MLDWVHLQSFLAIARCGNLSGAAKSLGVTQSTMGRRLETLHLSAGARLLAKTSSGYVLTAAGEAVLQNVERMETEALSVERAIAAKDEQIAGEIRITTVEAFGANVIMPLLTPLLLRHPDLQVEIITDYRALSLTRREADIAIRLAEFEQQEAFVQRVGGMTFGLFANPQYLERREWLGIGDTTTEHALVTAQQDLAVMPEAAHLCQIVPNATVVVRANSRRVQLEAVRSGLGLGQLPWYLAKPCDDLVELGAPHSRIDRGMWLGVHREARNVPRMRLVIDHLAAGLRRMSDQLVPPVTVR